MDRNKIRFKTHHDFEWCDEVRIRTVPRYKQSGLSGDEWRTSAVTEFLRDGEVIHTESTAKVEWAVAMLPGQYLTVPETLDAPNPPYGADPGVCFQPGCSKEPVTTYRPRFLYDRSGNRFENKYNEHLRFCDEHKTRGDCGLEDADANYEVVEYVCGEAP